MRNRPIIILLIFSLSLNLATLGTLIYYFSFSSKNLERINGSTLRELRYRLPSELYNSRAQLKRRLFKNWQIFQTQRDELFDLFMAKEPDLKAIEDKIDEISALQNRFQKQIARQILKEIRQLPPDKRRSYILFLKRRVCRGGMLFRPGRMRYHRKR